MHGSRALQALIGFALVPLGGCILGSAQQSIGAVDCTQPVPFDVRVEVLRPPETHSRQETRSVTGFVVEVRSEGLTYADGATDDEGCVGFVLKVPGTYEAQAHRIENGGCLSVGQASFEYQYDQPIHPRRVPVIVHFGCF